MILLTRDAVETPGAFGPEARAFKRQVGQCAQRPLGTTSHVHLHQRVVVAIQRWNTAAVLGFASAANRQLIMSIACMHGT